MEDEGCERLGIQTSDTNHQLIDLVSLENGKVLETNICARADLLGLAKDYSCLVCKNEENGICKYRLVSLEWLFDR